MPCGPTRTRWTTLACLPMPRCCRGRISRPRSPWPAVSWSSRTIRSPIPRSSSAARSSSRSPTLTPPSRGRGKRRHRRGWSPWSATASVTRSARRLRAPRHRSTATLQPRSPSPSRGDPRQAVGTAVRVRASGDGAGDAHPAHAPGRAGLRRGPDRLGVRAAACGVGTAPRAGETPDPRRRYPVPGPDPAGWPAVPAQPYQAYGCGPSLTGHRSHVAGGLLCSRTARGRRRSRWSRGAVGHREGAARWCSAWHWTRRSHSALRARSVYRRHPGFLPERRPAPGLLAVAWRHHVIERACPGGSERAPGVTRC